MSGPLPDQKSGGMRVALGGIMGGGVCGVIYEGGARCMRVEVGGVMEVL